MSIGPPPPEPGYATTEFWITLVVQLMGLLTMFHAISFTADQTQAILGLAGLVVPQLAYALSRGIRKQGT